MQSRSVSHSSIYLQLQSLTVCLYILDVWYVHVKCFHGNNNVFTPSSHQFHLLLQKRLLSLTKSEKSCAEITMREEYGFLMISCFVLAEWPLDCLLKVMTDNCLLHIWYQKNALTCKLMFQKSSLFVLEFIWPCSNEVSKSEEWSGDPASFLQCSCLSVYMKLTHQHGFRLFAFTFCVQQNLLPNMN